MPDGFGERLAVLHRLKNIQGVIGAKKVGLQCHRVIQKARRLAANGWYFGKRGEITGKSKQQISGYQKSMSLRPLRGAYLIHPALLVVADL